MAEGEDITMEVNENQTNNGTEAKPEVLEASPNDVHDVNVTETGATDTDASNGEDKKEFKMPVLLVGPRKGVHKFTKIKPTSEAESTPEAVVADSPPETEQLTESERLKLAKSPAERQRDLATPLAYKEPSWASVPDKKYSLEVLKSGAIAETYELTGSKFVFGRSVACECVMAHPSISRYHAVLQFGQQPEDDSPGFYVYDLSSTHGTFFNKLKIKPHLYVRLRVGHMIKLGLSTRMFLLQGPQDDVEPESEQTVTQLQNERLKIKLAAQLAATQGEKEDQGIDWGLGEDADEETDLSHNPFAAAPNEELYIDDPKKTLRGWFEREGIELQYDCQEKGFSQFVCRVELPVDDSRGQSIVAEAVVKGKKKEAVIQCALEACRILDQHGLLRQSNHESRKKKRKDWEADDFYDSDEDTFLDRTGTVERKRQKRMAEAGVTQIVHTHSGLLEEHGRIMGEAERVKAALATATEPAAGASTSTDDELDMYMAKLAAQSVDKSKVHSLKAELAKLKQDEHRIRTLANIAKPAGTPDLENPWPAEESAAPSTAVKPTKQLPIIGKRRTALKPLPPKVVPDKTKKLKEDIGEEEFDSD